MNLLGISFSNSLIVLKYVFQRSTTHIDLCRWRWNYRTRNYSIRCL